MALLKIPLIIPGQVIKIIFTVEESLRPRGLQIILIKTEPKVKEWFTGRIYLNESMEEALRLERTPQAALANAAKKLQLDIQ